MAGNDDVQEDELEHQQRNAESPPNDGANAEVGVLSKPDVRSFPGSTIVDTSGSIPSTPDAVPPIAVEACPENLTPLASSSGNSQGVGRLDAPKPLLLAGELT
jgi:hypothetical protein